MQPIASRIRQRLLITRAEPDDLARLLDHLLDRAGNPGLMTAGLKDTLVAHASGNPRALAIMADGLLTAAAGQDRDILDEKGTVPGSPKIVLLESRGTAERKQRQRYTGAALRHR